MFAQAREARLVGATPCSGDLEPVGQAASGAGDPALAARRAVTVGDEYRQAVVAPIALERSGQITARNSKRRDLADPSCSHVDGWTRIPYSVAGTTRHGQAEQLAAVSGETSRRERNQRSFGPDGTGYPNRVRRRIGGWA